MKLVFAFAGSSVFRHLEGLLTELRRRGHEVVVVTTLDDGSAHPNVDGRALLAAAAADKGLTVSDWCIGGLRKGSAVLRELRNYSTFFRPGHPSTALRERWKKYLPSRLWRWVGSPWVGRLLASAPAWWLFRRLEALTPPSSPVVEWLRKSGADCVVACPYILPYALEVEYIKAAQALGLPSLVAVQSWDNLTTKGTFAVLPDRLLLWNEALRDEAVALHDVPASRITVTGSPTFDYWFAMAPTLDRAAFACQCGIDPKRPYVVYLCSSRGMIEEEKRYVADLAAEMRANPATRDATLLVRPHPLNVLDWSDIESAQVRVWPPRGEFTDNPDARRNFFHTLHYGVATLGVNTSAMLEAAVADKPCITVIDPRYQSAQSGMGHFRHLLDGGFLQVATSYSQAAAQLGDILAGQDPLATGRHAFVRRFVRPQGLERPAAAVMADAIETALGPQVRTVRKEL
jgi:hypothetical protein